MHGMHGILDAWLPSEPLSPGNTLPKPCGDSIHHVWLVISPFVCTCMKCLEALDFLWFCRYFMHNAFALARLSFNFLERGMEREEKGHEVEEKEGVCGI